VVWGESSKVGCLRRGSGGVRSNEEGFGGSWGRRLERVGSNTSALPQSQHTVFVALPLTQRKHPAFTPYF
jgi:hypothetical protein